jgi:predicted short-subunit dehydrogenase-like oxidoreductase (DUF2520 family)
MTPARPPATLCIVGPGRLGLSLGAALHRSGLLERLVFIGRRDDPPDHPLLAGPRPSARYVPDPAEVCNAPPDAILLTVPDSAIGAAAERLAELRLPPVPVLHTSGVLPSSVLSPLSLRGHPVGSLHPLVTAADPLSGTDLLEGAWFGAEGDEGAMALAGWIVGALSGRCLAIDPAAKAVYHAAAVAASNHVVALLAAAERLMRAAGVAEAEARDAVSRLAAGAVANVAREGPARALTGPVARGDVATVERHLRDLSPPERPLYSVLAREALELARTRGLDPAAARELARLLGEGVP